MNELKPYTLPQFQSAKAAAAAAAKAAAKNKKRYEQTQKQARKQQKQYSPAGFVSAGVPPATLTPSPPSDYSFNGYSPRTSSSSTSSLYEDDLRSVAATTTTNATTTAPSIRSSYSTYGFSGASGLTSLSGMGISGPPPALSASSQAANSNGVNSVSPNRAPKQDCSQLLHHQHQPFVLPQEQTGKHDAATQTEETPPASTPLAPHDDASADPHTQPPEAPVKIPHSLHPTVHSGVLPLAFDSSDAHTAYSAKSAETARPDDDEFVLTDVRDDGKKPQHKHTTGHIVKGEFANLVGHVPHPHIQHHKHHKDYKPEYVDLTSARDKEEEEDEEEDGLHSAPSHALSSHEPPSPKRRGDGYAKLPSKDHKDKSTPNKEHMSVVTATPPETHTAPDASHIQVHSLGVPQPQSPSPESTTVSPTNSVSPAYLSSLSSYNKDDHDMEDEVAEKEADEFFDAAESVDEAETSGYFSSRRPPHHTDNDAVDPLSMEDVSSGTDKTSVLDTHDTNDTADAVAKPASIASPEVASAAATTTTPLLPPTAPFASPLLKEQSPPMTRRQTAPTTNTMPPQAASSLHPPHATHRPSHSFSRRRSVPVQAHVHNHPDCIQLLDEHEQNEVNRLRDSIIAQREYKKKRREFVEDDKVLVGTKVSEGHDNYVTAYNMLTGLRVAVSRCNAKNDRPLTDEDFTARHKLAFDIVGNELTPSAKYDFKFKDYSPWVFRHLRELFKLDPADYLMSLTSKYIVSELGSPGKSGSFFYFSRDYRFIIKTIHHSEHKQLRKILKDYYNHVKANPNTLISQFYGLHRVKLPFGRKIHFIVMNNLFPPHRDIHRTFDLKGSSIGRELPVPLPTNEEEEAALAQGENLQNAAMVFKDINWIKAKQTINLGPTKREQFLKQLQVDVELLKRLNIMDYSLLIGIHDLKKGNTEGLRDNLLSVFQPVDSNNTSGKPDELRRVISATSPTAFNTQDMPYVVNE